MTRTLRRDARTKGASVITGLRLEAEVANELCEKAVEVAQDARTGRGNVSELARYYIRTGLGLSPQDANRREEIGGFDACLAGLAMEEDLCQQLARVAHQLGLPKAGAARHFIRLGLGYSEENSRDREAHFAELAASKHQAAMGGHEQFRGTR